MRGHDGRPVGRSHTNPFFDTCEHEIEFTDGSREKCTANVIAENMHAQVNDEGHQCQTLSEIQDHCKDNTAMPKEQGKIVANGIKKDKIMTKGWELQKG